MQTDLGVKLLTHSISHSKIFSDGPKCNVRKTERSSKWINATLKNSVYRKVPKFWDPRKLCCNLPKTQTKRPNLRVFRQKDANGIANSEDPDQTAPLRAV